MNGQAEAAGNELPEDQLSFESSASDNSIDLDDINDIAVSYELRIPHQEDESRLTDLE